MLGEHPEEELGILNGYAHLLAQNVRLVVLRKVLVQHSQVQEAR